MENNVQSPQYQPPVAPEQKPSNGLAIASLVLGILSIIMVFVYAWVGIICAIVGIVLAVVAKKQNPSGLATAGLVLSIIALAICIISIIAVVACAGALLGALGSMLPICAYIQAGVLRLPVFLIYEVTYVCTLSYSLETCPSASMRC